MCMCVLEMEEGKEGIKTPIWMSFSDMGCRLSEGSYTLTVDTREKQAEQQTLQPRHRSYRYRHCMCVRNCGISSKYKLISTPVYSPCSGAASHSHTKVYIYASNLPFQVIARTPSYHRHSSLGHAALRDLYQRGGVVSPAPPPLTNVQFAIPRTLSCS